jgi:phosphoglycolate phosphatase
VNKDILKANGKPDAIIFDWDNTLVDSWLTILDALNTTFKAFHLPPWTMEEARVNVAKSMRDSFPALFGDNWQDAGEVFYKRYSAIHVEGLCPLAGADTMLRKLTNANIYLSVVSNKNGEYVRAEAKHLGWDHYFGTLVGALDAELDKPDPKPVDLALEPIGIKRGPSVWFAGDARIDLECAYNAGLTPILIRKQAPGPQEFLDYPPAGYFKDCDALCKFVINL